MRKLTVLIGLIAVVAALPAVALAKSSPGVIRQGNCSNGADWKLKAKLDDGRIETEFEVDQNVAGRAWRVVITRDGTVVFRGTRVTRPPSGSFSLTRRIANPRGPDRIVATAKAVGRAGSCRAALTI
jgi:hypothetical protein